MDESLDVGLIHGWMDEQMDENGKTDEDGWRMNYRKLVEWVKRGELI